MFRLNFWWPILIIGAIWVIFSWPYLRFGQVPFPTTYLVSNFSPWNTQYGQAVKNGAMPDVITQIYPWKKLTIDIWKSGQIPLWNPYSFSGTVHAANYQTAVFSPFNLLFVIMSFSDAWSWTILLQPILAALGMYWLLSVNKCSVYARLIGSMAFMFCGFLVAWMAYGTLGYAVLWLPYILASISEYVQTNRLRYGISLALAIVLSFVSGHFQMSVYVSLVAIFYIIYKSWPRRIWPLGITLLGWFSVGILLASPQLLLTFDAYAKSIRSQSMGAGSIPWKYLFTIFAPDLYGNPVTRNDWFGQYAEFSSYLGVLPLILGIYGLMFAKRREKSIFVVIVVTALLLAANSPLNWLLYQSHIPALSTSTATRIIVLASFGLATLAAFGFDVLIADLGVKNWRRVGRFFIFIIIAVIGIWLLAASGTIIPPDKWLIAKRNLVLPSVLAFVCAGFAAAGLVIPRRWHLAIALLFVAITAFDVTRFAIKWMPFDPPALIYPEHKSTTKMQSIVGHDRILANFTAESGVTFRLPLIEGYDAMYQARYGEFLSSGHDGRIGIPERSVVTLDKHGMYSEQIMQLLGVRYYLHKLSDGRYGWSYPYWNFPGYQAVYKDEYYEILENINASPRARLVSSYEIHVDKQEIVRAVLNTKAAEDKIILEQKPPVEPVVGRGQVSFLTDTPNEISLSVDSTGPKLLLLSDAYDPGWKATIDGKSVPIYRANFAFRSVSVPPGQHVVKFVYWPRGLTWGIILAGVGVFIVLYKSSWKIYENWHY